MQWYYAVDGEQRGPLSDEDFIDLVKKGTIRSRTQVWNETMTDWKQYKDVRSFVDQLEANSKSDNAQPGRAEVVCAECHKLFSKDDVVEYQGMYVCGECKTAFFQRIDEGSTAYSQGEGGIGETPNADLTARARETLQGNWGIAVGFSFLYIMLTQLCQLPMQFMQIIGMLLPEELRIIFTIIIVVLMVVVIYAISGALQLGQSRFFLDVVRGEMLGIGRLFYGFKYFKKAACTYLLMLLIIMLWTLLLIIPGIMASFSYGMTFYVLADNPDMSTLEVLAFSKKIMYGNRFKLFMLGLRFIGWSILSIFTCYIGFLWLMPYMSTSFAAFYEDVRGIE